jgi:hypothetical protein
MKKLIIPQHKSTDLSLLKGLNPVKIIKIAGDLKKATLEGNIPVSRQENIYINSEYGTVAVAHYDNHFIFRDPMYERKVGRSMLMCTCGSIGVVVGAKDYANNASPTTGKDSTHPGQMIVCLLHQKNGKHADGSS